ncbi:MAG: AAA family ATPase [Xanthobacter sp.]
MACLIAFSGLPGAGKSTIAKAVARTSGAFLLRVDEIDAAIWALDPQRDIGPESYHIAAALAVSNLRLGHSVIADCVNPWPLTRAIFTSAAERACCAFLGIEVICSDPAVHKKRVEERVSDIIGLKVPDWATVMQRDYKPWPEAQLHLDTARLDVKAAVERICLAIPD